MTEGLKSLNEVYEGVAGIKNHTKKCCWPYAIFALKMPLVLCFDQIVQQKTKSTYLLLAQARRNQGELGTSIQ